VKPILAATLLTLVAPGGPSVTGESEPPAPLDRVAIAGASLSDGFGLETETGVRTRMSDVLDEALTVPLELVADRSNTLFFLDPEANGKEAIDAVLGTEPTCLFAVDFLFWFAYGARAEERRLAFFERGLALLDRVPCTLVVGDLPDMSGAVGGGMLTAAMVPELENLEAMRKRLDAWCDERPRIVRVSLTALAEAQEAAEATRIGPLELDAETAELLLQEDRLHPSLYGTTAVVLLALDALVRGEGELERSHVTGWDVPVLAERVGERVRAARDALRRAE
jgi:hypothetical protein